jgi:dihydrofolate synthase/folylpolyglutamate synthase
VRTLEQWLALQESAHALHIDLGLERVTAVARTLGVDRPKSRVITVGGTNGKGSTVGHIDAILRASGISSGAFTSPHLVRYNERIRVNGAEVSDAALIEAFERIEQARGQITLTFFEYNTLAALLIFERERVDVAVLEVGLGGRLDATNLVDADVAVVCSIGLDHRDYLGNTLEEIGAEKAGIFRSGRPAVLGSSEMPRSVFETIQRVNATSVVAGRDFTWDVHDTRWNYSGPRISLADLPPSALPGDIQYRNAATALAALEALGVPLRESAVSEALKAVRVPGRFQIVPGSIEWIFDVSHNEPAAQVLAGNLRARPVSGRTICIASILRDKDVEAIGRILSPVVDTWIPATVPGPRGLTAPEIAKRLGLGTSPLALADSIEQACELARAAAKPGDRVLVCGGFHAVGSALKWLQLY